MASPCIILFMSRQVDKDGLIHLTQPKDSVLTPRTRDTAIHTTTQTVISKPKNFDKAMARLKEKGNLDGHNFSSAAELGMFIDWYNDTVTKTSEKKASGEIVEITKFLIRTMTQKTFIPKGKPTAEKKSS